MRKLSCSKESSAPFQVICLIQPPSTASQSLASPSSSMFLFPHLAAVAPTSSFLPHRCLILFLSFPASLKDFPSQPQPLFPSSHCIGSWYRIQVLSILSKSSILRTRWEWWWMKIKGSANPSIPPHSNHLPRAKDDERQVRRRDGGREPCWGEQRAQGSWAAKCVENQLNKRKDGFCHWAVCYFHTGR